MSEASYCWRIFLGCTGNWLISFFRWPLKCSIGSWPFLCTWVLFWFWKTIIYRRHWLAEIWGAYVWWKMDMHGVLRFAGCRKQLWYHLQGLGEYSEEEKKQVAGCIVRICFIRSWQICHPRNLTLQCVCVLLFKISKTFIIDVHWYSSHH